MGTYLTLENLKLGNNASDGRNTIESLDGNNPLGLQTQGGNVGIGVSNPGVSFAIGGDDTGINYVTGDKLDFLAANNRIVTMTGSSVGIGTDNPVSKLHIYENSNSVHYDAGLTIENSGDGDAICQYLITNVRRWVTGIDNSDSDKFKIASSADLNTDSRLTIDTNGNVGIRETSPGRALHIKTSGGYPQMRLETTESFSPQAWDINVESNSLAFYRPYPTSAYKILSSGGASDTSDDRLKANEEYITGALDTIMKLKPQVFNMIIDGVVQEAKTPGLIAQDVYYDCPELRYLVDVPDDAVPGDKPNTPEDPTQDPDYSNWGSTYAGLQYTAFPIYLIKAVQELKTINDTQQTTITTLETDLTAEKAKTATLETEVSTLQTQVADLLARVTALENP